MKQNEYRAQGLKGRVDVVPIGAKKRKIDKDVIQLHCAFLRSLYNLDIDLPKSRLLMWTRNQGWKQPMYTTLQIDKLFQSTVIVNDMKYTSTYW